MNVINDKSIDNSSNKKNHLQDITNIGHLLNNDEELKSLNEKNDINSLFYYFINKEKIYNKKGTKPINKNNFMNLINILKEYINQNEDYILYYFTKIKVDMLKVIINGYIDFKLEEKEKNEIYNFIIIIIPFFFDKKIFYYIYKKLSKIFRTFTFSENKKLLLEQFNKIFDIWKLLYKVENLKIVNQSYIALLGNKNGLVLDFNQFKKRAKINSVIISIEFSPLFQKNNINENTFTFLKTYYKNVESIEVKLFNIRANEQEKINKINFKITPNFYNYNINGSLEFENENKNIIIAMHDSKCEIEKIEILKNYIGTIKSFNVVVEYNNNKNRTEFYLTLKDNFEKGQKFYNIESVSNSESTDKEEKIQLYFYSPDEKLMSYKKMNEIFYEDIKYYNGIECFIPILKIIKYFIDEFKNDSEKIISLYKYIIQIMKVIINIICYSKKNYSNFQKIFTSLIGALAEINHVLPKNYQKDLYSDNIFSTLYILIISSPLTLAQKNSYIMITGLQDLDKLNINLDDLLINLNILEINCFHYYTIILYTYIEFILLVYNNQNKVPKNIYEQLIKLEEKANKRAGEETQITIFIQLLLGNLNFICEIKDEDNILKNFQKVNNINSFLDEKTNIFDDRKFYIRNIIAIIKSYFYLIDFINKFTKNEKIINYEDINKEKEIKDIIEPSIKNENNKIIINEEDNHLTNEYNSKFIIFFDSLEEIFSQTNFEETITNGLKDFINHKDYIIKTFHLKDDQGFYIESEKIIKEFTDYHGDYHKLMKRLFIYNRFWSDKKLYYNEEKKKLLKYKYINYYTTNFQRPLLFPVNDYKYKYPNFQKYKIKEDFYITEENKDNYNFYLDCPELDEFTIKYEQEIIQKIETDYQFNINSYEACFIKKTHHVKGKLFVLTKYGLIKKFIFYCYPYNIAEKTPCCNVSKEMENINLNNEKLCFGQTFPCPKYDMNKKIFIDIKDVRLILRRIYFYRKTAIEIFTRTKSYYFNCAEDFNSKNSKKGEMNCSNIINQMGFYSQSDFFPINLNEQLLGYSKEFVEIVKKYADQKKNNNSLIDIKNKFISVLFDHFKPSEKDKEYSSLDMIIYLNLLSNRSYIDLFQYPVFPLLFLYEKDAKKNEYIYKERELKKHIGFQEVSEKATKRAEMVKFTYAQTIKEFEEISDETLEPDSPYYFQTHYSNNVYTCHYLIRFFPFCFLSIEFQGAEFDNPNRLFFSIEETFFNISSQKSDVRELIPEFYYFPEMFLNINKINFDKRCNGELVDDVEIPKNIDIIENYLNENNSYSNIKNNSEKDKEKTSNYFLCFKFVEKMRNLLESKTNEINNWINLIFGNKTKYKTSKKKDQYFRTQSYIDFSDEKEKEFQNYVKNKDIMLSVDFGISPVQTLFKQKEILDYFNRNIIYDKKVKERKELSQSIYNDFISTMDELKDKNQKVQKEKNINFGRISKISYANRYSKCVQNNNNKVDVYDKNKKEFISSKKIVKFFYNKKDIIELKGYKTGKVKIIINSPSYSNELYDHNEEITCIHYNERLNMFCTTSKDGFLNLYMLPNKLMTSLKNPNGNYFNIAFLSSNPFPSIIAFDEKSYELFSYSINGFFIKKASILELLDLKERKSNLEIFHKFNEKGGTYKDRLIFIEENIKGKNFKCQLFTLPFFDREEKKYEIKRKFSII